MDLPPRLAYSHNKKYHSGIRGIYNTNTSTTMVFANEKPVLLRLQYHDYFYHSHSKKYHSSNRSIIFIPHFMIK